MNIKWLERPRLIGATCIPKMSRQKGDVICNVNRRECYIPLMRLQTSPDPMRDVTITMTPGPAQTSGARVTLLLSDFTEAGVQASPYSYLNSDINTSKPAERLLHSYLIVSNAEHSVAGS